MVCFRLLTEYHSFLLIIKNLKFRFNEKSFRLLTEYHSFLFLSGDIKSTDIKVSVSLRSIIHSYKRHLKYCFKWYYLFMFPSPYGVSFILISKQRDYVINNCSTYGFRLLTEYHSFLSYGQKSLLLQYVFRMLSCNIFIFEIFLFISVESIFNSSFFTYRLTNIFL